MSETKYPVGTTAQGCVSGATYTRNESGRWSMPDGGLTFSDREVGVGGNLVYPVLPSAPEIKLGTVVEAAYDGDCDRIHFVCFAAEQADPAFVAVGQSAYYTYDADDEAPVYPLSELSDVTVNGVPLMPPVPEIEEPVKIGTLVHDKFDAPWVRVVYGWLGAAEVREQSPVSWNELTADNGPLTLVED